MSSIFKYLTLEKKMGHGGKRIGSGRRKFTDEERKLRYEISRKKTYEKYKKRNLLKLRRYNQEIRFKVLQHYSAQIPFCACCGEKELKFLCIDHINGGGNKHRRTITNGKGGNMPFWLYRNNFPSGFQILCHNCNMAKGFYKTCPHKVVEESLKV